MRRNVLLIGAFILVLAASACNLAGQPETEVTLAVNSDAPTSETEPTSVVNSDSPTDESSKSGAGGGQATTCFYSAAGIAAPHPVYRQADATSAQIGAADINILYPVTAQSEVYYQIELLDGQIGWVRNVTGGLSGDCAALPIQNARPAAPEGVCSFFLDVPGLELYGTADGQNVMGTVPAFVYIPVELRSSIGSVRLRLDDGRVGWVVWPETMLQEMQALSGPCYALPVEQLSTG